MAVPSVLKPVDCVSVGLLLQTKSTTSDVVPTVKGAAVNVDVAVSNAISLTLPAMSFLNAAREMPGDLLLMVSISP